MTMKVRVTNLSNWKHEDVIVGDRSIRLHPGDSTDVSVSRDEATVISVRPETAIGGAKPEPYLMNGVQMEPYTETHFRSMAGQHRPQNKA